MMSLFISPLSMVSAILSRSTWDKQALNQQHTMLGIIIIFYFKATDKVMALNMPTYVHRWNPLVSNLVDEM